MIFFRKYLTLFLLVFFCSLISSYILFSKVYLDNKQLVNSSDRLTSISPLLPSSIVPDEKIDSEIVLVFAGDAMFDRHIRLFAEKNGYEYILEDFSDLFSSADEVILNLEGPITENKSVSVGSEVGSTRNFIFTFDPSIIQFFKKWNVTTVNLGNNHIQNFGEKGVESTYAFLRTEEIAAFGDVGTNPVEHTRYIVREIRDKQIAFVSYNEFVPNSKVHVFEDINKVKEEADIVIVYSHWGAEYLPTANETIQKLAHEFIDSGADLVIGGHPHVTQQKEEYKGKMIYYSLGNFVFDQYFSKETMQGLVVRVTIAKDSNMFFEEIPVKMEKDGKTVIQEN